MKKVQITIRTTIYAAAVLLGISGAQSVMAADSVSLITDFGFNGRHAYFFVAIEKGYYTEAGLDVKIIGGKGSVDAIPNRRSASARSRFA